MLWKLEKIGDKYSLTTGRIRTNSAVRDRSWLAAIVGLGGDYGIVRKFVKAAHDVYDNHNGEQTFHGLLVGTIYECRAIWEGDSAHQYMKCGGGKSGFFTVAHDGETEWLEKSHVIARLKAVATMT